MAGDRSDPEPEEKAHHSYLRAQDLRLGATVCVLMGLSMSGTPLARHQALAVTDSWLPPLKRSAAWVTVDGLGYVYPGGGASTHRSAAPERVASMPWVSRFSTARRFGRCVWRRRARAGQARARVLVVSVKGVVWHFSPAGNRSFMAQAGHVGRAADSHRQGRHRRRPIDLLAGV